MTEAGANTTTNNADSHKARAKAILSSGRELYPRLPRNVAVKDMSCRHFLAAFDYLVAAQTAADVELSIQGMSGWRPTGGYTVECSRKS